MDTQTITVSPITKEGLKCYLYFDEKLSAGDTILAHYQTVLTRTSFSSTVTNTTTGTIYNQRMKVNMTILAKYITLQGNQPITGFTLEDTTGES